MSKYLHLVVFAALLPCHRRACEEERAAVGGNDLLLQQTLLCLHLPHQIIQMGFLWWCQCQGGETSMLSGPSVYIFTQLLFIMHTQKSWLSHSVIKINIPSIHTFRLTKNVYYFNWSRVFISCNATLLMLPPFSH